MKIYGPYTRKDGRSHVVIVEDGKRRTMSYPRFLIENQFGRKLLPHEHVDHIDNNPRNNDVSNLQVLHYIDNIRKSAKPAEIGKFICPTCGIEFTRSMRDYRHNQLAYGKSGPYCSRRCAGIAHN